jgi:hypothetical protein
MVRPITKDTVLCMSLAGRPSNIGTRFHSFLYAELELDFVYKAFTTTDLAAAIAGIRALGHARLRGLQMVQRREGLRLHRPRVRRRRLRSFQRDPVGWLPLT